MTSKSAAAEGSTAALNGSGAMFDAIAHRYDLLNRLISLGRDQAWRRQTVRGLRLISTDLVLDVATGTADLAMMAAVSCPGVRVVGIDPSPKMVDIGIGKIARSGLAGHVELSLGDAQALPMASGHFDAAMMAFGIRNVPDRPRALAELARVVRPGGRVAILELSEPRAGLLAPLARAHARYVVPLVASLLSSRSEYDYLQSSIRAFPAPSEFASMMTSAGLEVEEIRPLTFGVVVLYLAVSRGDGRSST